MGDESAIINLQVPVDLKKWLEGKAESELTSLSAVARRILVDAQRKEEAAQLAAKES